MPGYTVTVTRPTRRDQVKPGDCFRSSHGYDVLVTEVRDKAPNRVEHRSVAITGHLHANPDAPTRTERYPANLLVDVFSRQTVETLEEARGEAIARSLPACMPDHGASRAARLAIRTLPASGGTIGPLPDGSTITVERVGGGS